MKRVDDARNSRGLLPGLALGFMLVAGGCLVPRDASNDGADSAPSEEGAAVVGVLPNGQLAGGAELQGRPPMRGVQRFEPTQGFEPTLGITAKGSIFVNSAVFTDGLGQPGNVPAFLYIYGSFDQGETWKDVTGRLPDPWPFGTGKRGLRTPPHTADPFLHVDVDTGRVYTADSGAPSATLFWSDDQGQTWEGAPVQVGDHQTIVTGKPRVSITAGYPNIVYWCVNDVGPPTTCAASLDGGKTFPPRRPVSLSPCEGQIREGGLVGHLATDRSGRVLLPSGRCGKEAVLFISEDDGSTWQTHVVDARAGLFPGGDLKSHEVHVAADDDENLYVFWIARNGRPHYAFSVDHGATWSNPRDIAPPDVTATDYHAVAAGGPGKVAFVYLGTRHPGGYAANQNASDWDGALWDAYVAQVTDATNPAAIVWTTTFNPPGDPVGVNDCASNRCNDMMGENMGIGDFVDVDIDSEGRLWAAMADMCHEACRQTGHQDYNLGFVGTLSEGFALNAAGGLLEALPYVAVK